MTGRLFDTPNQTAPACVVEMAKTPPACFEADGWRSYVLEAWRAALNDPSERAAMARGTLPDYCADCTVAYRIRMESVNRCFPISVAPTVKETT